MIERLDTDHDTATRQIRAVRRAEQMAERIGESRHMLSFLKQANATADQRKLGASLRAICLNSEADTDVDVPAEIRRIVAADPMFVDPEITVEICRVAVHRVLNEHLSAAERERNVAAAMSRAAQGRGYIRRSARDGDWTDADLERLLTTIEEEGMRRGKRFDLSAIADRMGMEDDPQTRVRICSRLKKWRCCVATIASSLEMTPRLEVAQSVQMLHVLRSRHSRTDSGVRWGFVMDQIREHAHGGDVTLERCSADVMHKKKLLGA